MDHKRVRNEHRSETAIGSFITKAAEEADARVSRSIQGPPLTDQEAVILADSAHVPAQLYTTVVVTDLTVGEQQSYRIVRENEGDLSRGEISLSSPLGRALLMEYPGALVKMKAPGGVRLYRILRVEE